MTSQFKIIQINSLNQFFMIMEWVIVYTEYFWHFKYYFYDYLRLHFYLKVNIIVVLLLLSARVPVLKL